MGGVQVCVCFGKLLQYEMNDGSAFSPNKYLEEVGKCSTPGSVAQKKAFFDAHYKKIAAMKKLAEAEAQEPPPIEVEVDDESPFNSSITATDKLEEAALVNAESMKLVQEHFQVDLQQLKMDPKKEEKKQTTAFSDDWSKTRRRSLFMEQMGDKDIVKRVFKTFLLPNQPDTNYQKQIIINQSSRSARKATDKLVNPQLALKTQDRSQTVVGGQVKGRKKESTSNAKGN